MESTHAVHTTRFDSRSSKTRRPAVLGSVALGSDIGSTMFEVMSAVAEGADGIDLSFPDGLAPTERLWVADQLVDASGIDLYLRSSLPMSSGRHTLILPLDGTRTRRIGSAVFDVGVDGPDQAPEWRWPDDDRPLLVSTGWLEPTNDASIMGLVTVATSKGVAAISTGRVRTVRRVVDTLAPVLAAEGAAECR